MVIADTEVELDLDSDVQFAPETAWSTNADPNDPCTSFFQDGPPRPTIVEHFTSTVNASVQFESTGALTHAISSANTAALTRHE